MSTDPLAAGVIAIVRQTRAGAAEHAGVVLASGGITALEVALTTPDAIEALKVLLTRLDPSVAVGIGTVRRPSEAEQAIDAGAAFLVTPAVRLDVLQVAGSAGVPTICGATTTTEALTAMDGGATAVKLFPARSLGGPGYLKEIRAPLPDVPFVPTGGVTLDDVPAYRSAGALAVAVGGALLPGDAAGAVDEHELRARARCFVDAWRTAAGAAS